MKKFCFCQSLFFILFSIVSTAAAQSPEKTTYQSWYSFNFVKALPINGAIIINPEINHLISGEVPWNAYSIDNTFEYYPNNSWDLIASLQVAYTNQKEGFDNVEIRPYVGARYNITKPEKRVFITLQGRYDFRFIYYIGDEPDIYSGRFRIRPEVRVSLNRKLYLADKNLILRVAGEYFYQVDEAVKEQFMSKQVGVIGLQYRHSHAWRYEFRYQLYKNKNTMEATKPTSVDHVAYFLVSWFL